MSLLLFRDCLLLWYPENCSINDEIILNSQELPFQIILLISWIEAIVCRCSSKIGVLKKFANFTKKHLCWSLFLIKFLKMSPIFTGKHLCCSLFLIRLAQVFSCEIYKFLTTPFFTEYLQWLPVSSSTLPVIEWILHLTKV